MKITDAIYTDLGFTTIRKWLGTEAFSEQNKDDFLHLSPTSNRTELLESHQFTEEILGGLHREEVLPIRHIPNTESWMDQLGIAGSQLDGENFKALLNLLVQSREIKVAMTTEYYPHWATQLDGLISFPQGEKQIYSVYDDAFEIRHDASAELRQIYSDIDKTRGQVQSRLHSLFTQAQSSGWLQDDHIAWRNGRSVLPMKASQKRKIKGIVQSQSATGQTVFIEPLEIIELNNDLTHLEFKRVEEIGRILRGLTTFFKPYKNELFTTIHLLVKIDFHYTFAKFAHHTESSVPLFSEENNLILEEARNPILELAEKEVVPLQMNLSADETILLLSGPNAGGKTVALKTVGLFSIMAQCGLFIPAKKCILPIYTQLLCDIGDQQSIEDDLSTFSAHIQNLTKITETADEKTLILLDELGTGTDPDAGAAISRAIMENILDKGSRLLATTHLGALKSWAHETDGVMNGGMVFDPKGLVPTYELQLGYPGASYAIEIATRMGLDDEIIDRAKSLVGDNSVKLEDILRILEIEQQSAKELKNVLELREKALIDKERVVKYLEQEVRKKHKLAKSTAAEEAEALIRETRREMENLVAHIRSSEADSASIQQAKHGFDKSIKLLKKHKVKLPPEKVFTPISIDDATEGAMVYIPHLDMEGTIIHPPNNKQKITVEANGLKLTLKCDQVAAHKKVKTKSTSRTISTNQVDRPQSMQLDLRGMRVDPALLELEQFLDRALISGMSHVNILHGKGTGALMEVVGEFLKGQSFVKKFNFAHEEQGGAGITEVEFK